MGTLQSQLARYDEEHEFLRWLVLPEEDRARYSIPPSSGGYRWFRSLNVVCLEKARQLRATARVKVRGEHTD